MRTLNIVGCGRAGRTFARLFHQAHWFPVRICGHFGFGILLLGRFALRCRCGCTGRTRTARARWNTLTVAIFFGGGRHRNRSRVLYLARFGFAGRCRLILGRLLFLLRSDVSVGGVDVLVVNCFFDIVSLALIFSHTFLRDRRAYSNLRARGFAAAPIVLGYLVHRPRNAVHEPWV